MITKTSDYIAIEITGVHKHNGKIFVNLEYPTSTNLAFRNIPDYRQHFALFIDRSTRRPFIRGCSRVQPNFHKFIQSDQILSRLLSPRRV